jgi:hypothetical protein
MPIVQALGDYDDGETGGMIGKGNRSTRRKPAPVPLCTPQTPQAARTRTRAAAVGSGQSSNSDFGYPNTIRSFYFLQEIQEKCINMTFLFSFVSTIRLF